MTSPRRASGLSHRSVLACSPLCHPRSRATGPAGGLTWVCCVPGGTVGAASPPGASPPEGPAGRTPRGEGVSCYDCTLPSLDAANSPRWCDPPPSPPAAPTLGVPVQGSPGTKPGRLSRDGREGEGGPACTWCSAVRAPLPCWARGRARRWAPLMAASSCPLLPRHPRLGPPGAPAQPLLCLGLCSPSTSLPTLAPPSACPCRLGKRGLGAGVVVGPAGRPPAGPRGPSAAPGGPVAGSAAEAAGGRVPSNPGLHMCRRRPPPGLPPALVWWCRPLPADEHGGPGGPSPPPGEAPEPTPTLSPWPGSLGARGPSGRGLLLGLQPGRRASGPLFCWQP